MSTSTQVILEIVDGDNKLDLFQQLLDIGRFGDRPPFNLKVSYDDDGRSQSVLEIKILGITAENGSGECWLITGNITGCKGPRSLVHTFFYSGGGKFTGWYDTRTRKGTLTLQK